MSNFTYEDAEKFIAKTKSENNNDYKKKIIITDEYKGIVDWSKVYKVGDEPSNWKLVAGSMEKEPEWHKQGEDAGKLDMKKYPVYSWRSKDGARILITYADFISNKPNACHLFAQFPNRDEWYDLTMDNAGSPYMSNPWAVSPCSKDFAIKEMIRYNEDKSFIDIKPPQVKKEYKLR